MTIQAPYPGAVTPMPDGSVIGGGTEWPMEEFKNWYLQTYGREFTGDDAQANQVVQGFLQQQQQDMTSQEGSFEGWFDANLPALIGGTLMGATGAFSGGLTGGEETFLGAGVDPVVGADAAAGTSLFGTGTAAGGSMDLTDILEEFGNFTGGETTDSFLGAGVDPVTAADAASGVDLFESGGSILSTPAAKTALQALSTILKNGGSIEDWLKVAGAIGPSILGAIGSSQQSDALEKLAREQMGLEQGRFETLLGREDSRLAEQKAAIERAFQMGAPYRKQLSDLVSDPSSFLQSPGVRASVDQGTNSLARALSAKVGNPIENMTALGDIQGYSTNALYGKLGEEMQRLGTLGGLGSFGTAGATIPGIGTNLNQNVQNAGSQAQTGSIQADRDLLGNISYGLSSILNPQPQTNSIETQLARLLGGSNIFRTV